MTEFRDNFNRADGALGNGWTSLGGSIRIASQRVVNSAWGEAQRPIGVANGYQQAQALSDMPGSGHAPALVKVKCTGLVNSGYSAFLGGTQSACRLYLSGPKDGGGTFSVYTAPFTLQETTATVRITYDAGLLTAECLGYVSISYRSSVLAANTYVGFRLANVYGWADDFVASDSAPLGFDEVNEPLIQLATAQGVEFIGTGTSWIPGNPGEPIFEVDKGTLSGQEIQSATQATANYTPPQADDVATFTDPSTGLQDSVALSTGFAAEMSGSADEYFDTLQAGAGGLGPIDPIGFLQLLVDIGQLLQDVGDTTVAEMSARLGTRDDVPTLQESFLRLKANWEAIDHWLDTGTPDAPNLKDYASSTSTTVSAIDSAITQLRGIPALSLYDLVGFGDPDEISLRRIVDIVTAIRGTGGLDLDLLLTAIVNLKGVDLRDMSQIYTLLDAHQAEAHDAFLATAVILENLTSTNTNTLQDVLDKIDSLMSVGPGAFYEILSDLSLLTSNNTISLQDILSAISPVDLSDVLAHLDTIISDIGTLSSQETGHYNTVHGQLTTLQTSVNSLATAVSNLSGQLATARGDILAAIAAIRPADYPLWPGADDVTLGVPVSGAGELFIPGPLDGLLIDATVWPRDIEQWTNGGRHALKWAGHVTFTNDIAYTEEIQFPGTDKRVVVPKSMLTAASALVHLRVGVQATVTPWSYTP